VVNERYLDTLNDPELLSARAYGLPPLSEGTLVGVEAFGPNEFQVRYQAKYSRLDRCVIAEVRGPVPNDVAIDEAKTC
jgi:hypothetical protein